MNSIALFSALLFAPLTARGQGAELPNLMDKAPAMSDGVYGVGAGLGVGDPSGFNFALRTETLHTFSMMAGWNLTLGRLHVHADYQVPFAELNPPESVLAVTLYSGLGATMDVDDSLGFGARIPVVAAVSFDQPMEVYVELAPVVGVLPAVAFGMQGTLGVRGWFRPKASNSDGLQVGGE